VLTERMPPYAEDAEKAVVGSLLIDGEAIFEIDLNPNDFFTDQNKLVFESCQNLFKKQVGINQITVARDLAQRDKLEEIGGAAYLSRLVAEVPTSAHIVYYAEIVRNLQNKRLLISLGQSIMEDGYNAATADTAVQESIRKLLDFQTKNMKTGLAPIKDIAHDCAGEVLEWIEGARTIQGYSTGFKNLDKRIDGFQKSKLYVIAARPSMGKTQLFLNMARHQARQGLKIAIYSLEQSRKSILERMVFAEANLNRYQMPRSDQETQRKFWDKWAELAMLPIQVNDANRIQTASAMTEVMAMSKTQGVDIMYFDYINLAGDMDDSEVKRIGQIIDNLRVTARTVNIPVVAVSQLNRGPEARKDKRPVTADLRDSGVIEQVADVIMFLYRDEFYYKDFSFGDDGRKVPVKRNSLEVIIDKNREGPRGTSELFYNAETGFMGDMA